MIKGVSRGRGATAIRSAMVFPLYLMTWFGTMVSGFCLAIAGNIWQRAAEAVQCQLAALNESIGALAKCGAAGNVGS